MVNLRASTLEKYVFSVGPQENNGNEEKSI
jgi:hypothetical protein